MMNQHQREDAAAISALHLLRSYNQLLQPPGLLPSYSPFSSNSHSSETAKPGLTPGMVTTIDISPSLGAFQPYAALHFREDLTVHDCKSRRIYMDVNPLLVSDSGAFAGRKSRGEKKAIPEEQKDEKYFERRKRNNQAAKKSRDARKIREDQVALKAIFLEQENSMLRAQILTMREELQTLRRLMLMYRKPDTCHLVNQEARDSVVPLSATSPLCLSKRTSKDGFE